MNLCQYLDTDATAPISDNLMNKELLQKNGDENPSTEGEGNGDGTEGDGTEG